MIEDEGRQTRGHVENKTSTCQTVIEKDGVEHERRSRRKHRVSIDI